MKLRPVLFIIFCLGIILYYFLMRGLGEYGSMQAGMSAGTGGLKHKAVNFENIIIHGSFILYFALGIFCALGLAEKRPVKYHLMAAYCALSLPICMLLFHIATDPGANTSGLGIVFAFIVFGLMPWHISWLFLLPADSFVYPDRIKEKERKEAYRIIWKMERYKERERVITALIALIVINLLIYSANIEMAAFKMALLGVVFAATFRFMYLYNKKRRMVISKLESKNAHRI